MGKKDVHQHRFSAYYFMLCIINLTQCMFPRVILSRVYAFSVYVCLKYHRCWDNPNLGRYSDSDDQ